MSEAAIFQRQGDRFVPGPASTGPWGADRLHGGPVLGLFARAFERAAPDASLVVTRMTFDLFRPVPVVPLVVNVEALRQSARLSLLQATLLASDTQVARATALLLRSSEHDEKPEQSVRPPGPEGVTTESLMRGFRGSGFPPGFHTCVETRWVRGEGGALAIWFRLPLALVAGESASALQRAVALSDFANAVASIAAQERAANAVPYINTDATLYLSRAPEGEWICIMEHGRDTERGISVAASLLFDARGLFGRALQARLANSYAR